MLRDGARLAVSLYLPLDPGARSAPPVPCLLEALPYRKDDLTASYRPEYVRFARDHGYAVARVDLRGTGSSTGVMPGEYDASEQADLHEVIAWLAGQAWCTGAVGMFGTSWSGFNALQLACERPPALRAVVASYATDDRWTDDVHYMGGALRLLDLVDYPLYMVAMNGLPPVPELFGEGWREEWRRRVDATPAWLVEWLQQRVDGPYWRHGSVRTGGAGKGGGTAGYDRIACPTMLITGWADGYRNITYRMARALHATGTPVKVLAGPWSHASPATSVPGPRVDHVPLMVRWWDRWLRDDPNGVDAEPPLTVFVRGYRPPRPDLDEWAGRWQAHDVASLDAARDVVLGFTDAQVSGAVVDGATARYAPVPDVGVTAWNSCAAALPWGQPDDQTPDDARSLCLEWPVPAGTAVLGHPRVRLRLRPDAAAAAVSAKLSLVGAAGRPSMLVDRGLLNLAYRAGDHTAPEPCVPGEWLDVDVELEATAFETAGETLRLALAGADWPNTLSLPGGWSAVDLAASELVLPVSAGTPHPAPDLPPPPPEPADGADAVDAVDDAEHVEWRRGEDVLARTAWAEVDHGSSYGGHLGARCREHYTGRVEIDAGTGVQRATGATRFEIGWPGGIAATAEARLDVTVDAETIEVTVELDVGEGAEPFGSRGWHERLPRWPV
jgi:predicted acyl esterase